MAEKITYSDLSKAMKTFVVLGWLTIAFNAFTVLFYYTIYLFG